MAVTFSLLSVDGKLTPIRNEGRLASLREKGMSYLVASVLSGGAGRPAFGYTYRNQNPRRWLNRLTESSYNVFDFGQDGVVVRKIQKQNPKSNRALAKRSVRAKAEIGSWRQIS
jgi:hypothetical protein